MDDTELYREQILRHAGPVITGRFLGFQTSYTRSIKIGQSALLAVYMTASVTHGIAAMLKRGGGRRKLKDLKKGPEFLVTPVRLRDDLGQIYEIEMHGQLPQSALHRGDLVQVRTVPQKDAKLPVKLERIINLTTMQPLQPRIPTMWSHLGPVLLLQAAAGAVVLALIVAAWLR